MQNLSPTHFKVKKRVRQGASRNPQNSFFVSGNPWRSMGAMMYFAYIEVTYEEQRSITKFIGFEISRGIIFWTDTQARRLG